MRGLLIIATLIGLGGCAGPEAAPMASALSGWQTRAGTPLSIGEVAALGQSCLSRLEAQSIDSDQPVPDPVRDNPAYRPGGEGLANTPPAGIAAADRPIELLTLRRAASLGDGSAEECLYRKGIVRAP